MLRNHKIFCLTIIVFVAIAACSNPKILQKKWVVTDVEFIFSETENNTTDTLMEKITQNVLKKLLMNNVYDFNDNNECTISGNNHATTFKYKLIKSNKFIEFYNTETSNEVEIELLSENELIIITHNDQSSIKTKLILKPLTQ